MSELLILTFPENLSASDADLIRGELADQGVKAILIEGATSAITMRDPATPQYVQWSRKRYTSTGAIGEYLELAWYKPDADEQHRKWPEVSWFPAESKMETLGYQRVMLEVTP